VFGGRDQGKVQHQPAPAASARDGAGLLRCEKAAGRVRGARPPAWCAWLASSSGWSGTPSACLGCDGRLRRWGYAHARWIRVRAGVVAAGTALSGPLRWLRGHPRAVAGLGGRAAAPDAVPVIGAALLAAAQGHGYRREAAELGRPASTVRGWIRCATGHAELIRVQAIRLAAEMEGLLDPQRVRPVAGPARSGHSSLTAPDGISAAPNGAEPT